MSTMLQLIQVTSDEQIPHVHQLFREYVQLLHETAHQEYGISIDVDAILDMFIKGIDEFYPPRGRLIWPNTTSKSWE